MPHRRLANLSQSISAISSFSRTLCATLAPPLADKAWHTGPRPEVQHFPGDDVGGYSPEDVMLRTPCPQKA